MRKLILFLLVIPIFGNAQKLSELRTDYPLASKEVAVTEELFNELSSISKEDEASLVAYKGAVLTLKAKFAQSLKSKKTYFEQGAELLEHAVETKPDNIEIRCLRLSVQENAPKIVGYRKAISEDRQFILDNYRAVKDLEVKKFIKGFVMVSKAFNETEKQLF